VKSLTALQERNVAHANKLFDEAKSAAMAGNNAAAVAKFQQGLFFRPNFAEGHEMRAQVCSFHFSACSINLILAAIAEFTLQ
jgi:hypothetical protein